MAMNPSGINPSSPVRRTLIRAGHLSGADRCGAETRTPLLGVLCLGIQTLGQAFGGKVVCARGEIVHGKMGGIMHHKVRAFSRGCRHLLQRPLSFR